MSFRDEFGDFRWQQPLLLGVPWAETFGHTYLSYAPSKALTLSSKIFRPGVEHRTRTPDGSPPLSLNANAFRDNDQGEMEGPGPLLGHPPSTTVLKKLV